jgi:hypothetical protein
MIQGLPMIIRRSRGLKRRARAGPTNSVSDSSEAGMLDGLKPASLE